MKRSISLTIFTLLLLASIYGAIQMFTENPQEFLTTCLILIGVSWFVHSIAVAEIDSNE